MTNTKCENCGQPALESDLVCWQCGRQLPGRKKNASVDLPPKERWQASGSPNNLLAYSLLTLLVIAATLLMMGSLGRRPKVQISFGTRTANNAIMLTDAEESFTVTIPRAWEWSEVSGRLSKVDLFAMLRENAQIEAGAGPLAAEVTDFEVLLAALEPGVGGDSPQSFVMVGQSETLNRLEYPAAIRFVMGSGLDISEARIVDNFDKSHLRIVLDMPSDGEDQIDYRCQQQFVLGRGKAMLLAVCAPSGRYAGVLATIESIMSSFQRLAP